MFDSILLPLILLTVPLPVSAAPTEKALIASQRLDQIVVSRAGDLQPDRMETCDDVTFLRRIWLDLAGRVPPLMEAQAVASSSQPLDRAALVNRLLAAPEYSSYGARQWSEYLLGRRPFENEGFNGRLLQQYLREQLLSNRPYDEIVTELITSEGALDESGAVNFILRYDASPTPLAGAVGEKFMGVTLQCAECHDHPHSSWKRKDFWGLAAFFARLRRMNPSNPLPNEQFLAVLERPRGELLVVDKMAKADEQGNYPTRSVMPKLPGLPYRELSGSRRSELANWLTSGENPYFARHYANQLWRQLVGSALLSGLDPLAERASERAAEPEGQPAAGESEVLDFLAAEFANSRFDIQHLIRVIVLSQTYQRPCQQSVGHVAAVESASDRSELLREQQRFIRGHVRPLSADQIYLSLAQAFGFHFDENDFRLAQLTGEDFSYDIPTISFGAEPRTLGRALAMFSSEHVRGAVESAAQGALRIHGDSASPAHVQRLFLSLLSRRATSEELESCLELASEDLPQRGIEDLVWVLLNSAEFQTNH